MSYRKHFRVIAGALSLVGCAAPPARCLEPASRAESARQPSVQSAPPETPAARPTTLIFVRHAEKLDDSEDPPLTEEGRARAEELRRVLGEVAITAVYATAFRRTRATAEPLARAKGLTLRPYDADRAVGEARAMMQRHPGETVLVVGHSPSIPAMVNAMMGEDRLARLQRYDAIFVLTVPSRGEPILLPLRYGAPP